MMLTAAVPVFVILTVWLTVAFKATVPKLMLPGVAERLGGPGEGAGEGAGVGLGVGLGPGPPDTCVEPPAQPVTTQAAVRAIIRTAISLHCPHDHLFVNKKRSRLYRLPGGVLRRRCYARPDVISKKKTLRQNLYG